MPGGKKKFTTIEAKHSNSNIPPMVNTNFFNTYAVMEEYGNADSS